MIEKRPESEYFVHPGVIKPVIGEYLALVAYRSEGSGDCEFPKLSAADALRALKDLGFVRTMTIEAYYYYQTNDTDETFGVWIAKVIDGYCDQLGQEGQNPLDDSDGCILFAIEEYYEAYPDALDNLMENKRRESPPINSSKIWWNYEQATPYICKN